MKNFKEFNVQELDCDELKKIDGGIIFTIMLAMGVGAAVYGFFNHLNE